MSVYFVCFITDMMTYVGFGVAFMGWVGCTIYGKVVFLERVFSFKFC